MALASASSSPAPSAASAAAAALAAAALAARRAAPAAGGRLSRAGLPPRPDVAASPTAQSGLRSLLSPRPAGVAALPALDVAHAAPDRAPGLLDGGLGCLPSPASADAAPASAAPSTPTAAVAPTTATPAPPAAALAALAAVPSAGASAGLLLPPPSSGPVQTDLETEALLRPSYGQLRAPAQMVGGLAPQTLLLPSTPVVPALVTDEAAGVQGAPNALAEAPEKLGSPLLGPSSASACNGLSAATAAVVAGAGWVHVGRGRHSGRRAPPEPSREGLERSLAFKRWARGRCFRCLERGHQVSACREPFRCIRCRRPGHRERFCRARSPVACDRSPVARGGSPVACAPRQRSRSPSVQPCPSLARSWAEVVGHSSLCVSVPPRSQSGCCKDSNVCTSLVSALESQLALLRTELLQEVELLRTELRDALAKFEVASVVPLLPELQVGSIDEDTKCCFGDFSPRALHVMPLVRGSAVFTEVVAPVLQIMPEL